MGHPKHKPQGQLPPLLDGPVAAPPPPRLCYLFEVAAVTPPVNAGGHTVLFEDTFAQQVHITGFNNGKSGDNGLRTVYSLRNAGDVHRELLSHWRKATPPNAYVLAKDCEGKHRATSWQSFFVYSDYDQRMPKDIHQRWEKLGCAMANTDRSHVIAAVFPTHSPDVKHKRRGDINVYDLPLRQGILAGKGDTIFITPRLIVHPNCPLPEPGRDVLFTGYPTMIIDEKRPNHYFLICEATDPSMIKSLTVELPKQDVVTEHPTASRQQQLCFG